MPETCDIISFPVVRLYSLWPLYRVDPRNKPEGKPEFPFGKYPYGDKKVINMMKKGLSYSEVFDKYMQLNIKDLVDLDKFHSESLLNGKELEKKCDLKIFDFIEENFSKKRLLFTVNHPTPDLILYQVEQILLSVTGATIPESEKIRVRRNPPLDFMQVPVHPQIIDHFELEWISKDYKYKYGQKDFVTFEEYYWNYINFI